MHQHRDKNRHSSSNFMGSWTVKVFMLFIQQKQVYWKRMENIAQCTNSSALITLFMVLLTSVHFPECFCGLWTPQLLSGEVCLPRLFRQAIRMRKLLIRSRNAYKLELNMRFWQCLLFVELSFSAILSKLNPLLIFINPIS